MSSSEKRLLFCISFSENDTMSMNCRTEKMRKFPKRDLVPLMIHDIC